MQCEEILNCQTWKLGLFRRRSFSQIKSGGTPQLTHWPLPMRAAAKPGLEVDPVDEAGKAGARTSATTMVVTNNISIRGILSTHFPRSSSTSHPHGSNSNHNSHPPGGSSSSSDIHSHSSGDRGISRRPTDPGPTGRDHLPVSSSIPGPAGRGHFPNSSTGGRPHPRRRHHRGGDQPHWQQVLCQWCGEAEHFPANCRAAAPASVPQHRPYAASSFPGAYAAQYNTCLRRTTPATHLPSRCHRRLDLSDRLHELHLHRHLPRKLTGTFSLGNPRRYGRNTCLRDCWTACRHRSGR